MTADNLSCRLVKFDATAVAMKLVLAKECYSLLACVLCFESIGTFLHVPYNL